MLTKDGIFMQNAIRNERYVLNCIDSDGMEKPVTPNVIIEEILFRPKGAMSQLDHKDWKRIQFVLRMNDIRHYKPSIKEKEESVLEKKKIDEKPTTTTKGMVESNNNEKATTTLAKKNTRHRC